MKINDLARLTNLLSLLKEAPTAWHATTLTAQALEKEGYTPLNEADAWNLTPGDKYMVTRNGSTLAAFIMPKKAPTTARVMGSHTDSPGLKVKPYADSKEESMAMVGVEVYGGPLLSSWLNRDLAIAGRVVYETKSGKVEETLVHFADNALVIPQLAIHLDKDVNEQGSDC